MEGKYVEIDLMKYIPLDSYVTLDHEFRVKLFEKAKKKIGNRAKLARLIKTNKTSLWEWEIGRTRPPLGIVLQCTKILDISKKELASRITNISIFYKNGSIFVKDWKLTLNEEFAEWLGLLRGDGTVHKKYVDCSNTCLNIVFFFANYLEKSFGIKKYQVEMTIVLPTDGGFKDTKPIDTVLRKKGYSNINLYKFKRRKKGNKILIKARFNGKVLAQILLEIMSDLFELIKNSPGSVKAAYVRGFAAAEGSVWQSGSARKISISQKDTDELIFVKSLLNDLGIKHVSDSKPIQRGNQIIITTRIELERFQKLVGFGSNVIRDKKLEHILSNYQDRAYNKPRAQRYKEILCLLKKKNKILSREIRTVLKIKYKHMNALLNEMLNQNMINVDRSTRPFVYFLGDNSG